MRRQSRLVPYADGKLFPLFIDGNGLVGVGHILIQPVIEKLSAVKQAEGTDCIPHADEMGLAFIAIGFFEPVRDRIVSPSVVDFAGIGNQIATAFCRRPTLCSMPAKHRTAKAPRL